MKDIFNRPQLVFWSHKLNNMLIYTRPTFGMFATLEGSNGNKICVSETNFAKEFNLEYIGELKSTETSVMTHGILRLNS